MLHLLAENVLHHAFKPGLLAYCPTMDLIAIGTIDEQGHVFRMNAQNVWTISNKSSEFVLSDLKWKPDGSLLAVAFSKSAVGGGEVRLLNSQNGKIVHLINLSKHTTSSIEKLSWTFHYTSIKRDGKVDLVDALDNLDLSDRPENDDRAHLKMAEDLPSQLMFLDNEGIIPKLPILPVESNQDEVFNTRASLDALFHNSTKEQNIKINVLLAALGDGNTHVSIYDAFEIGAFDHQRTTGVPQASLANFASSAESSTVGTLLQSQASTSQNASFVPLDLKFIPDAGTYSSLLASKSMRMQNLLRYVENVRSQLASEYNASQDLPHRFIRNIDEDLAEKEGTNFTNAIYHYICTQRASETMRNWLLDELGDNGQKRWQRAAIGGYTNMQRYTHEALIPALDRLALLTSRLRGLSRVSELSTSLGLETLTLDSVLDIVNCLQILSRQILLVVTKELNQAQAFCAWLAREIKAKGTSDGLTYAGEEKLVMPDYQSLLDYVHDVLPESALHPLLKSSRDLTSKPKDIIGDEANFSQSYKKALRQYVQTGTIGPDLLSLQDLLEKLSRNCGVVFARIAESQRRKIRFGDVQRLDIDMMSNDTVMRTIVTTDNKHQETKQNSNFTTTYIAVAKDNYLKCTKITLSTHNGISSFESRQDITIELPVGSTARACQFMDDSKLVFALILASSSHLIYLPYNSTEGFSIFDNEFKDQHNLLSEDGLVRFIRHTFEEGPAFTPEFIEVNGRKGRRVICVLTEDRVHYRLYDIDSWIVLDEDDRLDDENFKRSMDMDQL